MNLSVTIEPKKKKNRRKKEQEDELASMLSDQLAAGIRTKCPGETSQRLSLTCNPQGNPIGSI